MTAFVFHAGCGVASRVRSPVISMAPAQISLPPFFLLIIIRNKSNLPGVGARRSRPQDAAHSEGTVRTL